MDLKCLRTLSAYLKPKSLSKVHSHFSQNTFDPCLVILELENPGCIEYPGSLPGRSKEPMGGFCAVATDAVYSIKKHLRQCLCGIIPACFDLLLIFQSKIISTSPKIDLNQSCFCHATVSSRQGESVKL